MPNTYVALRTETVAVATGTVTINLSGISGYTDLVLQCSLRADTSTFNNMNFPLLRFNGDSTSGLYSVTNLYARNTGGGDTAASQRSSNQNEINLGGVATSAMASGIFSTYQVNIQNYANTSVNKTVLARIGTGGNLTASDGVWASVGLWRNTNAITSITLTATSSGLFQVGSTISLYGIANADQGAAKATGGMITEDSTYWYHTFAASGAFIPKQSLTCDVLVVAGGGGGGRTVGGGGGAGGLLGFASQSLTATSYNVTVGGGGAGATTISVAGTNGVDSQFGALTLVKGGGGGGSYSAAAVIGGSGGGGGYNGGSGSGASPTSGQGFAGGTAFSNDWSAAGGGGAGAVGANGVNLLAGNGGVGSTAYSSWGVVTGVGQNVSGTVYFAGGGGGGANSSAVGTTAGAGGLGGGAAGLPQASQGVPTAALANTGGGGGGSGGNGNTSNGGTGGSGVVIVRYLKA
jgi:hypothetical protein